MIPMPSMPGNLSDSGSAISGAPITADFVFTGGSINKNQLSPYLIPCLIIAAAILYKRGR